MYYNIVVMIKIFPVLFCFCLFCAPFAFSEEIEIDSEVLGFVPGSAFFLIRAGDSAGVEIGDGLIVHRAGKKIAEAYIIEVREEVSAAEILRVVKGEGIREGDAILIVKEPGKLEAGPDIIAEIEQEREVSEPELKPSVSEKGDIISIEIDREPKAVFTYTTVVLRENGYSITTSSRATGILVATKPISLSLLKELWADAVAAIGHKLVVSFDLKDEGNYSMLTASAFEEHSQKGRHVKRPVKKDSQYYNELLDIISEIRERSE